MPRRLATLFFLMTVGCSVLSPSSLAAQGNFFEVSRHTIDIDAEFDDTVVLTAPALVINVPALDKVDGIGLAYGGMADKAAWSLSHVRADPRAPSVLGDTTAALRMYGVDLFAYPWLKQGTVGISPLLRLGASYTYLNIPGSATDGVTLGDANYRTLGFNLGAGAILRVAKVFHITADYTRRFVKFSRARAFDEKPRINGGLSATSDVLMIGLGVYPPWP